MPNIYLSPSLQEHNQYISDAGSEEYYMNLVVDAMIPYLRGSNITFTRNNPLDTLSQVIKKSNQENYDFHLAIHSNAAPKNLSGALQGPDVYYYPSSQEGKKAANIFSDNLKAIYPNPKLVATIPNTTLAELRKIKAPSILTELAYHDNPNDAQWIVDNINTIGKNLVLSLTDYFK
ncbi:MAG: N-acetylmuramoyl-L-alanine amidase [Anaerovoracaceae bacterium]